MTPATAFMTMSDSMKKLTEKLDFLVNNSRTPTSPTKRHRETPVQSDEEDDQPEEQADTAVKKAANTFPVSSPMKAFLQTSFCLPKPVDNATRRRWLEKFGLPAGDETHCPKMDSLIKGELGKEALEADRKLSRFQNFTLDAAGPLVAALEEFEKEDANAETVAAAIQQSLLLLGNASTQFSVERRAKALAKLNPDFKSMAGDEDFSQAPPYLFGPGFEKKAKERTEALECLRKVSKPTFSSYRPNTRTAILPRFRKWLFRATRFHQSGGSGGSGNYYCRREGLPSGPKTAGPKKG